jgi:hypothetical protein
VSSYKTCGNINSNFIRIKNEDHNLNRHIRVILKTYINIATSKLVTCTSTFYIAKTLRSDQGTEILNKELTAYLEANHTNHIVCSKDEHASIGAAENSIGVLRTSAKAMMLAGNIPKRYWQFVVSHAAYLNNIVAPSRCDRTKTIFEILFGRRADVRRIPPIGAFCAVYADRRQLQDQSFGLTSKQGVFIGIARYKKVLGYVVTDGKSLFVTRDHITFDPQLFPFKLKPTSSPDWQTFYNLTNPVAEGAVLHKSPSATPENHIPDYASDESDLDPDFDSSQNPESADINDTPTYESVRIPGSRPGIMWTCIVRVTGIMSTMIPGEGIQHACGQFEHAIDSVNLARVKRKEKKRRETWFPFNFV